MLASAWLQMVILAGLQGPVPASPEAALQAYQSAVARADVVALADLTSGSPGVTLRKLAPALKKAQNASDALTKTLASKPAWNLSNPLAQQFNPLAGHALEIIEITREKDQHLGRVRFGLQGKLQEETLSIRNDDGQLRVSLPGNFLKSVSGMKTEQLNRQIEVLNKLSEILLSLSEQIEKEEIKTREEVLIKLAQAIQENKLGLQN